ncbi:XrtA/PEP-CTERM system histidine kinase PrsK [Haliea sp. E17]|uniref:XrtA/PEP-CTERM system histidine kinase PrsK n=1 Tax=Haliea sp. E17 TaxID=3401576 RepID=UPI003AAAE711
MLSYGSAWLAYSVLGLGLTLRWRNRALSLSALVCVALTAIWGAVVAIGSQFEYPPVKLIEIAEAARNGAWMFLLYNLYSQMLDGKGRFFGNRQWLPWFFAGICLLLVHLFTSGWLLERLGLPAELERTFTFLMWLGFTLGSLVLLEQVFRLSSLTERWRLKYLFLGLGSIFVFDFLMYTEGLILRQVNPLLWEARGFIVAFTAPLLGISILRSQKRSPEAQVSRNVVFHTVTLLLAGVYLIFISCVAFAINVYGGTWGGVLQITFLSVAGIFFLTVVLSSRARDVLRVWMSKHFFSYRYDYRREWLDFTQTLAESANATPTAITQAMTKLCGSPSALLWMRADNGEFSLIENWQMEEPGDVGDFRPMVEWLERTAWIIDFNERQYHPEVYTDLKLPEGLENFQRVWLIVPLMFTNRLQGILLMTRPDVLPQMNWEDRDLLKVAGRAAATHLARFQAHASLVELRQFEAFNRLSAYVVHDLKNILAQQSLILSNASRHREKPEFIDDVFETIDNSVQRMTRLMAQMRSGLRGSRRETVELVPLLERVISNKSNTMPVPRMVRARREYLVEADAEQLTTVFGHIIQNAQDATSPGGTVTVSLQEEQDRVKVLIKDSGVGMDENFIKNRLFTPFDTTKGLTGMGIGVVESRDYIRGLGGEVQVMSKPGVGSCFTVVLPCASHLHLNKNKAVSEEAVVGK